MDGHGEYPQRKQIRLPEFKYAAGTYFVTVCTQDRKCLLSEIISRKMTGVNVGEGLGPPVEVRLTPYGTIAQEQLLNLENRYATVTIQQYVIMPNHIHAIIQIQEHLDKTGGASPSPTLIDVIRTFKSITARMCNKLYPIPQLFQRSFYDHVIRCETDYLEIARYIDENPAKWSQDEFYISHSDTNQKEGSLWT